MSRNPGKATAIARSVLTMLLSGSACGAVFAEEILYVVRDDRLVFTNTADRSSARPVPGMKSSGTRKVPLSRLPRTIYDPFIERVAGEVGLSPSLIKAVAKVESNFDPHAVSPKGAQGLMQLMPQTARQYGVRDPFDPFQNLRAGAVHLRHLLDQFDGDLVLTLAAYNAGAEAVRRHGGVPAYAETREYVRRVSEYLGLPAPSRGGGARPAAKPVRMVRGADGTVTLAN